MWIQLAPIPDTLIVPDSHTNSAERFAFGLLSTGWASYADMGLLMDLLPSASRSRRSSVTDLTQTGGKLFYCGAYRHGPMGGLMTNTMQYPNVSRLLASCIKGLSPAACFTSLAFHRNILTSPHIDNNEPGINNLIVPLSRWKGGQLWVANPHGRDYIRAATVPGNIIQVSPPMIAIDANKLHATMPWEGGDRLILIAYHVRQPVLSPRERCILANIGITPSSPSSHTVVID